MCLCILTYIVHILKGHPISTWYKNAICYLRQVYRMRNVPVLPVEIGSPSWSCAWWIAGETVPELTAVNVAGVTSSDTCGLFVLSLRGRGHLWRLGGKQRRRLNKWHVGLSAARGGVMTRHLLLLLPLLLLLINGGLQPNAQGACFRLRSQWRSAYGCQHVCLHLPQIDVSLWTWSGRSERILIRRRF